MTEDSHQVALVTGAGKGIGRAIALALAKQGAFVYVNFLTHRESAQETLDEIKLNNGRGDLLQFNVTSRQDADLAVKAIIRDRAKIDILVNNAGIRSDTLLAMMKESSWQTVMDTNLNGFYNVTRPVVRNMLKNRFGRIVNVASTAGQMGNAGQVNYSAAKAGLIGATKALAREVGSRNITVNAVAPGFIETGMLEGTRLEGIMDSIPAGRLGQPQEVAHTVLFLCSREAGYVNGQVIGVNGGMI
jgi:3-oxoacyl-[acyl-carrier protein] reductase